MLADEKTEGAFTGRTAENNATPIAPKAKLSCVDTSMLVAKDGAEILLEEGPLTLGRSHTSNIVIKAKGISRSHARIYPGHNGWAIEDLRSTNGVRVNNDRVTQTWLKPGDVVSLGRIRYKYEVEGMTEDDDDEKTRPPTDRANVDDTTLVQFNARTAPIFTTPMDEKTIPQNGSFSLSDQTTFVRFATNAVTNTSTTSEAKTNANLESPKPESGRIRRFFS